MKYIIGIDEVGRGALAGPVTVAALALPSNSKLKTKDSKKLSPKQREIWFKYIKKHPKIFYAVVSASPKIIDKINISQAANLAATRALEKLISYSQFSISKCKIVLDGGLYLRVDPRIYLRLSASTIIKGDEKIPAIALASIVAKVTRDRLMTRLHKKFPIYNFQKHKGYGTKAHFRALKKHGPSSIHRRSFRSILQSRRRGV